MSENMQTCSSCGELVPIEYVICVWCGFDLTAEHIRRAGIVIRRKESFQRMKKVILNPIEGFKEITLIPDLKGPRYIFYFIGIMMTLNMLAVFSKLDGLSFNANESEIALTENISIKVTTIVALTFLLIQPVVLLIIFTVIWKLGTRIISAFSRSFGGTGDREKVRSVIGYSMLPVLFGWTLAWLLRLLSGAEDVSESGSYDSIESAIVNVTQEGIGGFGNFIITISWIYATVLGIIGVSKATRLSYFEGVIVAGIPYLLFMSIVVF